MEERIQCKVAELKRKTSFFRPRTYESLREEAMRIIKEEIVQEEAYTTTKGRARSY